MRRGFKTESEKAALRARAALKLKPSAPLNPWAYAAHLGVQILDIQNLKLSEGAKKQLLVIDFRSWSAMTIKGPTCTAIVINQAHALTRQTNDLMHELSHIELRHTPNRVEMSTSGLLMVSNYSNEQEQEADWYAAAMLLPRDALAAARRRGQSAAEIAIEYGVSQALCAWRLRMTGVDVQLHRARGS